MNGRIIFYIGCFCAVLVLPFLLNYSGFCWEKKRWLSSQEKMDAAVLYILNTGTFSGRYFDSDGILRQKEISPIKYKNVEEFYAKNPSCCQFVARADDGFAPKLIDKLCGGPSLISSIEFKIYFHNKHGDVDFSSEKIFPFVNNCGYASVDF